MKIKYEMQRNTTLKKVPKSRTYWKNIAIPTWIEFLHYVVYSNITHKVQIIFKVLPIISCYFQNPLFQQIVDTAAPCVLKYSAIIHLEDQKYSASINKIIPVQKLQQLFIADITKIKDYLSQIGCKLAHQLKAKYHEDFVYFNYSLKSYSHVLNKGMGCLI